MKVYILPENKELFEKKFKQASKHLAVKPAITFGKVESKQKVTVVNWSCDGEYGTDKYKQVVDVIPVEIEEITSGDWDKVAAGFQVGQKVAIRNAKVVSRDYEEGYYGTTWFVKFDLGGVILTKSFGNIGTLDDFEQEDGTYSFMARVDFINNNKRTIRLGGRISKIR